MSYTLAGTVIRPPTSGGEANSTQYAANRVLSGANTRDYFGSNKRVWSYDYKNLNATDYATLNTIYQNYLSTKSAVTWSVNEGNYIVTQTTVLIDFLSRSFNIPGSSYLSDCTLILTEA